MGNSLGKGLNCVGYHAKPERLYGRRVEIDDISWNRIEEYIFRWAPVLQNKANYAYPITT